jgi:hypothetical protein
MRKIVIWSVLALMALAIAAVPALAAKPGAHEQKKDTITCFTSDEAGNPDPNGTRVTCTGTVSGLGNIDSANTEVLADFACSTRPMNNKPGGHLQDDSGPLPVTNGSLTFKVTTGPATCPNGLVPTIGESATVNIFTDNGSTLVYTTTVPIT